MSRHRQPASRARKGYSELNSELVAVRGRGLAHIDTYRGSFKPLTGIDTLVELANRYTADRSDLKRGQRIEQLIRDATPRIKDQGHRRRITLVFGLELGSYESATQLREDAARELNEVRLHPSTRVRRDRTAFMSLETAIYELLDAVDLHRDEGSSDATVATLQELVDRLGATLSRVATTEVQRIPFMVREDIPFFVGREDELEALREATEAGRNVVLHGVYGMGGVGKTSLAVRFAHRYRDSFPDGVISGQLDESGVPEVLFSWALAFGRERDFRDRQTLEDQILFIESLVSGRRVLAILDNATSSKQLAPLLRAVSGVAAIVTARSRNLAALRNARVVPVGPLPREMALDLLRQIIGAQLVDSDTASADALCRLTGYLPLALRIAAQRIKASNYGLAAYVDRLANHRALSELRIGSEKTKDTDVRASFDLSYADLDPASRKFFADLGVFVQSDFDAAAAAYVTRLNEGTATNHLEALHELSLVEPSTLLRWRLHPLLQEYAREHITDTEAYERMADYFVTLAEKADAELRGPEQTLWLARLDRESANIETALSWTLDNDHHEDSLRLLGALAWYWSGRGRQREIRSRLEDLLDEEALPPPVRAKAASTASQMIADMGDFDEARRWAEEALTLATSIGDEAIRATALSRAAYAAWCQGDYENAKTLATDSRAAADRVGDHTGVSTSWNILGLIAGYQSDYLSAASLLRKALVLRRKAKDTWGIATSLNNLGEVLRCQGDDRGAVKNYIASLRMRLEMGDLWSIANSLNNIGELLRHRGKLDLADVYYRRGLVLTRQIGNSVGLATSLAGLGGIAARRRQFRRAARLFGGADARLERARTRLGPANNADYAELVSEVRKALGANAYELEYRRGYQMNDEQIGGYALKGR